MLNKFFSFLFAASVVMIAPSCNSGKIACPTYADSFPEKKKAKKQTEPQIPKVTKPKSGLLPPNAKPVKKKD